MGPGCAWRSGCGRRCCRRRSSPAWTPARSRLAEVLALRSLLLNLHFRAAKGEPVAEAEMRGLIERADGAKMQRARERLEAVQSAARAGARATGPEPETASEIAAETNPEEE